MKALVDDAAKGTKLTTRNTRRNGSGRVPIYPELEKLLFQAVLTRRDQGFKVRFSFVAWLLSQCSCCTIHMFQSVTGRIEFMFDCEHVSMCFLTVLLCSWAYRYAESG